MIHGITRRLRGFFTIDSEVDVGTTVRVYLPAATKPEADVSDPAVPRYTALWVDDEPSLVAMGQRQLEAWGLAVRAHTSSLQALEEFRLRPEAFALVVSDNTMPHLAGLEFIGEVTRIRPGIATLMVTGHGSSVSPETLVTHGVKRVLPKPYDVDELRGVLRELLADPTLG